MKATVKEIQVCGGRLFATLEGACREYLDCLDQNIDREKLHFTVIMPDKSVKGITIRQEADGLVAYGDFDGLPNMLDYAREVEGEKELREDKG